MRQQTLFGADDEHGLKLAALCRVESEQLDAEAVGRRVTRAQKCCSAAAVDLAVGAAAQIRLHLLGHDAFVGVARLHDYVGGPHAEVVSVAALRHLVDGVAAHGARAARRDGNPVGAQRLADAFEHGIRAREYRERRLDTCLHVSLRCVDDHHELVNFVVDLDVLHRKPAAASRAHVGCAAVVCGNSRRHGEHLRCAAIVVGQREQRGLRQHVGQSQEQLGVGAVPSVDRLQRVADHEHVFVVAAQRLEERELQRVHVLCFVDEQMPEAESRRGGEVGALANGLRGERNEVVQIDQSAPTPLGFVARVGIGDLRQFDWHGTVGALRLAHVVLGRNDACLGPIDLGEHRAGATTERIFAKHAVEQCEAVADHVGHRGRRVARATTQQCEGDGVEGADRRLVGVARAVVARDAERA